MLKTLARIAGRLERALTVATAVLMAALALLVCWQVFARYVLHSSPFWVEELSVTAMMWIGLLGAAACVWSDSHMSLELVVRRLPAGAKAVLEICVDLAIGVFAGFLSLYGWRLAETTMTSLMSTLPLPLGLTYIVIPVAGVLMILFALARAFTKSVAFFAGRRRSFDA
jgi:TRAP-type C4-dicarboxylate transport system permease small subunit